MLVSSSSRPSLKIAAPRGELLWSSVTRVSCAVPVLKMPPPCCPAALVEAVESVIANVPWSLLPGGCVVRIPVVYRAARALDVGHAVVVENAACRCDTVPPRLSMPPP